jgi:hypothetical protein
MTVPRVDLDVDVRLRRRVALVAALLLNVAFLVVLDHLMQPGVKRRSAGARPEVADVLLVRLIEPSPPAVVVPTEAPPSVVSASATAPRPRRASADGSRAPVVKETTATDEQHSDNADDRAAAVAIPSEPAELRLYDRTGSVLVPDMHKAEGTSTVFPDRPRVAQEGNPFVHRSPLPYTPTRLDQYWPPVRETLGGELVRKATVKKSWRTPWGTQIECAWVLFFGGCGWGPEPRATAEELKQMRADPPMPRVPPSGGDASTSQ